MYASSLDYPNSLQPCPTPSLWTYIQHALTINMNPYKCGKQLKPRLDTLWEDQHSLITISF